MLEGEAGGIGIVAVVVVFVWLDMFVFVVIGYRWNGCSGFLANCYVMVVERVCDVLWVGVRFVFVG